MILAQAANPIMREAIGTVEMNRGSGRSEEVKAIVKGARKKGARPGFQHAGHRAAGAGIIFERGFPPSIFQPTDLVIHDDPETTLSGWQYGLIKIVLVGEFKPGGNDFTALEGSDLAAGGQPDLSRGGAGEENFSGSGSASRGGCGETIFESKEKPTIVEKPEIVIFIRSDGFDGTTRPGVSEGEWLEFTMLEAGQLSGFVTDPDNATSIFPKGSDATIAETWSIA